MKHRVCSSCSKLRPIEEFYKRYDRKDSYRTKCKYCMTSKHSEKFSSNWYKERFTEEELTLFSTLKNLCTKAKLRSNKEFDPNVNWEYLFDIWVEQNGLCVYSGLPLSTEANHPHKVSLDRIDSSKGYVKDNLQLVSASVNRMKQEFTEEFFISLCCSIALTCDE